jgi:hypothetical protein
MNGDDIWQKCDRGKSDDAHTWLELGRHPGLRLRCGGYNTQLGRIGAESACGCPNYTLKRTEASKITVFRIHSAVRTLSQFEVKLVDCGRVCPPNQRQVCGAVAEPFLHHRDDQVATLREAFFSAAASAGSISSIMSFRAG